jgi:hypothetical protein
VEGGAKFICDMQDEGRVFFFFLLYHPFLSLKNLGTRKKTNIYRAHSFIYLFVFVLVVLGFELRASHYCYAGPVPSEPCSEPFIFSIFQIEFLAFA